MSHGLANNHRVLCALKAKFATRLGSRRRIATGTPLSNGRRNGSYSLGSVDCILAIAAGGLLLFAGYIINYLIDKWRK